MSKDSPASKGPEWRKVRVKWYRNPWVWSVVIAAMVTGLGVFAAPKAKRAYDRWSGERAARRAAEFLARGDVKHAVIDARRALELNPRNAEANRVIAQILEASGAPGAREWRQRLESIQPGDAENLIALSNGAVQAGFPDAAAEALGKVKAQDRDSAAYHDAAARIAVARRDLADAESHWKEAARLDPGEDRYRLNLAILQRKSGDGTVREDALAELRELGAKPGSSRTAQRALLADAMARRDADGAKKAAEALASAPGATFGDRLERLSVLRTLRDPESSRLLAELRESAAANPGELFQLLTWMNEHDLALLVLDWLPELPPDVIAQPPVIVAVADARARAMDWEELKELVGPGAWGSFEFARLAYQARALERLDDRTGSEEAWKGALSAAGTGLQQLGMLVQLASRWRWEERGTELLRKMASTGSATGPVLDALWTAAMRHGDTEQLRAVSKLRMNASPKSVEARNNFACLSLLTNSNEGGIHEIADALFKELPGNPEVVSTYAHSLQKRGKLDEALAAMRTLAPEQLRQPAVARYHGILLAAANRGAEAAEFLALGQNGFILPEEKALIEHAKAAASGGATKYLAQLNDAAASPKPEELPKLITWMGTHGLAGVASGWSAGLAPEIAARPEVRVAIAEVHGKALEWQRLRTMAETGSWEELDYLRSAHLARALLSLQDTPAAENAWKKGLANAVEKDAGALERLARTAQGFGWQYKAGEALWQLALKPGCPRWAAESLWETSLARGTASDLSKSSRLLATFDTRHAPTTRDSAVVAAMLARANEEAMWEFAAELHAAAPADVVLAVIHALALHQQGRAADAKALAAGLDPEALKEPRSALYYSVFLTASKRPAEAAEYLDFAATRPLPVEEKSLPAKAKVAAQGGPPQPGGK